MGYPEDWADEKCPLHDEDGFCTIADLVCDGDEKNCALIT